MKVFNFAFFLFIALGGFEDIGKINELKEQAGEAYLNNDFSQAAEKYKKLVSDYKVNDEKVMINLANAYYHLRDTTNASQSYKNLATASDRSIKSQALHQLGVMSHQQKNLNEALSFFKESLRADPSNQGARYNYELVKKLLEKQKNEEEEQQNNEDEDKIKPSDYAKMLKEQAEQLVLSRRYLDALNLMQKGLQQDETVAYYNDFISRISDIVEIEQ